MPAGGSLRPMNDHRPTVGVVGAGQLARMCWQAAIGLDIDLRVLAARAGDAAARVMPHPLIGDPDDPAALAKLARVCEVVTLDHELVDVATLMDLEAAGHAIHPGGETLRFAQDKAHQRHRFAAAGLPVPPHTVVTSLGDAERFAADHGWPVVLKRPRGGYDGRGVWPVADAADLPRSWCDATGQTRAAAGAAGDGTGDAAGDDEMLVEQGVDITAEVAVLLARRPGGQRVTAPLIETVQRDGMLRELVVPARVPPHVHTTAMDLAARVADLVGVVGVCAVELFWDGRDVLVNEIAVRPHNCGHWTIDGASTSQFENHLRAVLDWPLGSMDPTHRAVCSVNVVGLDDTAWPQSQLATALQTHDVHVHLYGKQPRAGRKLGHVTATDDDIDVARDHAHAAAERLMTPVHVH